MITTGLLGVLAGAFLWMDRVFLFQFMVSRPMIMGPLIGLFMGDLKSGVLVGVSLELLWLNAPPVGAYLPADESFCTAVAVPVAVIAGTWAAPAVASGMSILLCLPCAFAGRALDMRLRTLNERLSTGSENAGPGGVSGVMIRAVSRSFAAAFVSLGMCTFVLGLAALSLGPVLPGSFHEAFAVVPFISVVVGLAALVSREMPRKLQVGIFTLGLAMVLLLTWVV